MALVPGNTPKFLSLFTLAIGGDYCQGREVAKAWEECQHGEA